MEWFFFRKTTSHNSLLQFIRYISLFLSLLNSSLSLNIGMSILVSSSPSIMNESIFLPCGNSDWSNQLSLRPLFSFLEKASDLNFNCRLLYDLSFVWTVDILQTDSGDSWAMSCNLTILVKAPLCCVVKQNSLFSIPLSIYPICNLHLQSIFIHFHRGQKIARRAKGTWVIPYIFLMRILVSYFIFSLIWV